VEEELLELEHSMELRAGLKHHANELKMIIKGVSIGIQRFNPSEWNSFVMTALGNVSSNKM